jgi:hypothetical protein
MTIATDSALPVGEVQEYVRRAWGGSPLNDTPQDCIAVGPGAQACAFTLVFLLANEALPSLLRKFRPDL